MNDTPQRIVIFGGPDRCGKTTIAKRLSWATGIPYFKPQNQGKIAVENPDIFRHQTTWAEPKLLDFIRQTKHSVIMDRSFVCDWAYSHVMERQRTHDEWNTLSDLEEAYAELDALLVVTVRKSYAGLKDDLNTAIDEAKLAKLDRQYRFYASETCLHNLVLETDDMDTRRQVIGIMTRLNQIERGRDE